MKFMRMKKTSESGKRGSCKDPNLIDLIATCGTGKFLNQFESKQKQSKRSDQFGLPPAQT
jgi:hypothetical protein